MDEEDNVGILTDNISEIICSQCGCEIDVSDLNPFIKVECPDCEKIEVVPAKLGQFLLLGLIGTGGMGGVYYAKDESLGRMVAIKVMLKSMGENKESMETFKREARAVAKLNHPNIAQIYSFGEEKGQQYIVMELISGQHIDKLIESGKKLNQGFIMRIGLQIAEALSAADEVGLIHGDIKPENILLDEKGKAKLVDFGLATFANQATTDGIWGTPYYIAPEKVRGHKIDARSDIYSLGATLYHALTSHPPFEGDTPVDVVKARLNNLPEKLSKIRSDIDNRVESIVLRMLQTQPAKRYPNYASLLSDLRKIVKLLKGGENGYDGKSKRFVTKKHSKMKITKGITAGNDELLSKSPKVIIQKKKSRELSILSEYKKRAMDIPIEEKSSKKSNKKTIILTILTILIVTGGIFTGIYLKKKKDKRISAIRESLALQDTKKNIKKKFNKLKYASTNIIIMANEVYAIAEKTTNIVYIVFEETMEIPKFNPKNIESKDSSSQQKISKNKRSSVINQFTNEVIMGKPGLDENEPEIKILTKKIFSNIQRISEKTLESKTILITADEIRKLALKSTTSRVAESKLQELSGSFNNLKKIKHETKEILTESKRFFNRIESTSSGIIKEKENKRRIEKEKAIKQAEDEARARKQNEHKLLVESELNLVKSTRNSNAFLLSQHKYKEAIEISVAQIANYKTDEGKMAAQVLVDRYSYLHKLKLFLIEKLTNDPFSWGWIQDRSPKDILSADNFNINIQGGKIPWEEVKTGQMLKMLNHYLSDPACRKIKIRELAEQNLATAIFCYENGGKQATVRFAKKAIEYRSSLKKEVKRLLPLELSGY